MYRFTHAVPVTPSTISPAATNPENGADRAAIVPPAASTIDPATPLRPPPDIHCTPITPIRIAAIIPIPFDLPGFRDDATSKPAPTSTANTTATPARSFVGYRNGRNE